MLENKGELVVKTSKDKSCVWGPHTITSVMQCPACFDTMPVGAMGRWVRFEGNPVTHVVCAHCFTHNTSRIPYIKTLLFKPAYEVGDIIVIQDGDVSKTAVVTGTKDDGTVTMHYLGATNERVLKHTWYNNGRKKCT